MALIGGKQENEGQNERAETTLQQITRTYHVIVAAFESQLGITRARWHVLRRLFEAGELSQAALQQQVNVDPAAITRQVKQLESEGLVTRTTDPKDNRYTLVRLTPSGCQLVEGLLPQRNAFEDALLDGLTGDERAVLQRCLTQIRTNVAHIQATGLAGEALT